MRRGTFDASFSPFCTVHNSLFCGPPALVASLLGQSVHAVSQVHPNPWLPESEGHCCALAEHWDPVPKRFWSRSTNSFPSALPTPPAQPKEAGPGSVLFTHQRRGDASAHCCGTQEEHFQVSPLQRTFSPPLEVLWGCVG